MYTCYSEKFLKGQRDEEGCISEWEKYKQCLSQHLDDKHLSRFLEADGLLDLNDQAEFKSKTGNLTKFLFLVL
ncbi:hypothetical protein AAHA92_32583 [Salvia divinorum]|uniref:Uncharacterized protein n=1 Tax=Salvia divinorum TaxID=28513 RepID=A0ABD1FL92_SALDI